MFSSSDSFIINEDALNFLDSTEKYSLIKDDIFKFNEIGADIIQFIETNKVSTFKEIIDYIESSYDVEKDDHRLLVSDFLSEAISFNVVSKK